MDTAVIPTITQVVMSHSAIESLVTEESLTESQKADWVMAGKPALSSWDGKQPFDKWLFRA